MLLKDTGHNASKLEKEQQERRMQATSNDSRIEAKEIASLVKALLPSVGTLRTAVHEVASQTPLSSSRICILNM